MKHPLAPLLALALGSLGIAACVARPDAHPERTISLLTHNTDDDGYGHTVYKTSDGYTVTDSVGRVPLNELVIFSDAQKRTVGMAGMASEAQTFNFVRRLYSEGGRVTGYLSGTDAATRETDPADATRADGDADTWLYALASLVLDADTAAAHTTAYQLHYSPAGRVTRVDMPRTGRSIKAPSGHHIRHEMRRNADFWLSDIHGGNILLYFYVEPDDVRAASRTVRTYCEGRLYYEDTFRNDTLVRRTLYAEADTPRAVATLERTPGPDALTTCYTERTPGQKEVWRSTWRAGRLESREQVSAYGTVLYQSLYRPSADGKAVIAYRKTYDRAAQKLVTTKTDRIDKTTFEAEHREADEMAFGMNGQYNWLGCD